MDQSFILSMFHKGYYCNFAYLNLALVLVKVSSGSGCKKGVVQAKIKVAINGFVRIGRNFLLCWRGRKDTPLDVVAINNTRGVNQASHLLNTTPPSASLMQM